MTHKIEEFLSTVRALRHPETGCPWDLKQNHQTLASYCIEEAHEVVEALESGDPEKMMDELGDLLLQIVLHAQLLSESKQGSFDGIIDRINRKMIERHPHVFEPQSEKMTSDEVLNTWNQRKMKKLNSDTPVSEKISQLPPQLPALHRAVRQGEILQAVGFDWKSPAEVVPKIHEELAELLNATSASNEKEELGDLLFVIAQWSRLKKIDPEQSLRAGCRKLEARVRWMETHAQEAFGRVFPELSLEEQEELWNRSKRV